MLCNVVAAAALLAIHADFMRSPIGFFNFLTYFVLLIALLAARSKRASIVLLILMLCRYALFPTLVLLAARGVHMRLV